MFRQTLLTLGKCLSLGMLANSLLLPVQAQPTATSGGATEAIELLILDRSTYKPIADRSTQVYSNNGIRCVTTPCPTNTKNWEGKTDRQGVVLIPKQVIQSSTTLTLNGYIAADLAKDLQQQPTGAAVILLVPTVK
ncbi:hypothetical protein [Chamaesiphon polymorphus]|uniref:hypothetical protein n=1 Tax=Chamaesiphon polymorphus TaxID=2107691 RepID=UPI0011B239A1|nr:hypothetical protein [Chamaesiphon polymorphus]